MLDRELGQAAEQRSQTGGVALLLQPRIWTHPQVARLSSHHRVAENKRRLSRQPQRDLIGGRHVNDAESIKQLVLIPDSMVERTVPSFRMWLRPHPCVVPRGDFGNAALMPEASAYDPRTATAIADDLVKSGPINDERIDQNEALRRGHRPPADDLLPALLAAFLRSPLGVRRLKAPKTSQDLTEQRLLHGEHLTDVTTVYDTLDAHA
jgi:hypothetical protein